MVLAGLVSVEKAEMAAALARHLTQAGQSVTIIDHSRRVPLAADAAADVPVIRLTGDLQTGLLPLLAGLTSAVIILTVSETLAPDALFTLLDDVRQQRPDLDVRTAALIDSRTCDCFPHFRASLEAGSDVIVRLPVGAGQGLEALL